MTEERARDALRRRRLFNVIEDQTAVKIDLIIRKERPFSMEELRRLVSCEWLWPRLRTPSFPGWSGRA